MTEVFVEQPLALPGSAKNAISPFFDASGNKNIGATTRISREI